MRKLTIIFLLFAFRASAQQLVPQDTINYATQAIVTTKAAKSYVVTNYAPVAAPALTNPNIGIALIPSQATTTPSADGTNGKFYVSTNANKMFATFEATTGITSPLQASLYKKHVGIWQAATGTTVPGIMGMAVFTTTGTATARAPATTTIGTRAIRLGCVSSATAGSLCFQNQPVVSFSAGSGTAADGSGFYCSSRFVPSDGATVSGERFFVGVSSSVSAPTNVEPNTLTNSIGMAQLSTDATQFYLVYGGSSAQSAIAMGTNLGAPTTTTTEYEFSIYAPPGTANTFYIQATNLNTGAIYTNTLTGAATVVPQSSTLLAWRIWKTNNATALAAAYDLCLFYLENDN